jgi:hypothetical protein
VSPQRSASKHSTNRSPLWIAILVLVVLAVGSAAFAFRKRSSLS